MRKLVLHAGPLTVLLATPAYAYIGPGVGVGAIAVVFGVIASIFLAFVAIIWYPLKRLFKGRKTFLTKKTAKTQSDARRKTSSNQAAKTRLDVSRKKSPDKAAKTQSDVE